jgi:hypothetical protein
MTLHEVYEMVVYNPYICTMWNRSLLHSKQA